MFRDYGFSFLDFLFLDRLGRRDVRGDLPELRKMTLPVGENARGQGTAGLLVMPGDKTLQFRLILRGDDPFGPDELVVVAAMAPYMTVLPMMLFFSGTKRCPGSGRTTISPPLMLLPT